MHPPNEPGCAVSALFASVTESFQHNSGALKSSKRVALGFGRGEEALEHHRMSCH
jgi:hypothetical protein